MKFLLKHMLLAYLAFGLVAVPSEALAAHKKSSKRLVSNHKHTSSKLVSSKKNGLSKHAISSRHQFGRMRAQQINVRLRAGHTLQLQREYASAENFDGSGALELASSNALIINQNTGEVLFAKNTNIPTPIASITKLMTAMVMLDAKLPQDQVLEISDNDIDYLKGTSSRLTIGTQMTRGEFLQLALMSSENRAASTLASNYPGGRALFVRAMNAKAHLIGLTNTHFVDPTGLDSENVSTAEDLAKMVQAAYQYSEIRAATTTSDRAVYLEGRAFPVLFKNTNGLVREGDWEIGLSKTGFINEAGRCLVMQATIAGEPMIVVLLNSNGKLTRIGDANRIRKWMEFNGVPTSAGQTLVMSGRIS
ncbi:MAG: D-alanyl-D-alanine endopeptidase [Bdellovibrio sp.]|nr:D-alanyl-D-alanine endopeptidase [Methylotenera sp.]